MKILNRFWIVILVFLFCMSSFAQGSLSIGGKSVISGKVLNGDSDFLRVILFDESGFSYISDKGTFSFSNLYRGRYLVCAKNWDKTLYNGNTTDISSAEWITLGDSSIVSDVELDMNKGEIKWVVFSGKLKLDSVYMPEAIGIILSNQLNWNEGPNEFIPITTGVQSDSTFCCTTLVPYGEYYVAIQPFDTTSIPGNFCMQWWSSGKSMHYENDLITVGKSNSMNFTILKTGSISGNLVIENFNKDADVYAIDKDGYIFSECEVSVRNGTGSFSLNSLPDGTYYIAVEPDDQERFYYNGASTIEDAEPLVISNGKIITDLELHRYPKPLLKRKLDKVTQAIKGKVSGTVTYQNSGDKALYLQIGLLATETNTGSSRAYYETTGSSNAFSIEADSGDYYLYARPVLKDYYYMLTWYREDGDTNYRSVVHINKNQEQTINLSLLSGGSVSGWVLDLNKKRNLESDFDDDFSYAHIILFDQNMRLTGKSILNSLSGFRFNGVKPGSYGLRVLPSPQIGTVARHSGFGYMTINGIRITGDSTSHIEAILPDSASAFITGIIPSSNQTTEMVYAYNSDSTLCGFGYAFPVGKVAAARDLFLEKLPLTTSTSLDFRVGPLPAGKYALARFSQSNKNCKLLWIGDKMSDDSTITDIDDYYKVSIPSNVQWIELEKAQQIRLSNRKLHNNGIGSAEILRVITKDGRTAIKLSLPKNLEHEISLSIFSLSGKLIKKFKNIYPVKQIFWDGTDSSGKKAGSGTYIVKLEIPGNGVHFLSFAFVL